MQQETIREAFIRASSFLEEKGVQESQHNAQLLLEHILGWDRTAFLMGLNEPFPTDLRIQWEQLLLRKASGEPAQYIIGEQEFYGLPFYVNPNVLIPRPETEILVETIMRIGKQLWPEAVQMENVPRTYPQLVDIGTGSGAISVTVAKLCPDWQVAASDLSTTALGVAKLNAERHRVGDRIQFYAGDLLDPFIASRLAIDIVVSNPPYIPTPEIRFLQPEVRHFEPNMALDGGVDGLFYYRKMLKQFKELSFMPKLVGFEAGMGQASELGQMLRASGCWDEVLIIPDLAGIERHVVGIKKS